MLPGSDGAIFSAQWKDSLWAKFLFDAFSSINRRPSGRKILWVLLTEPFAMPALHLAIVTDIHHGRDTFTKRGTAALPLLTRFVGEANADGVDAVIDLGDRISDENVETDRALLAEVAGAFKRLAVPRHHVAGNHDVAHLSLAENEATLDAPLATRAVAMGDIRLVFWQPDVTLTPARGFHLAPGDIEALQQLLSADERRTLLFSHVPLSGGSMRGNYWFENNPAHATYAEGDAIRAALAAAPCPLLCLSGHVHWNSLTIVDGIAHCTQQSLTETFTTLPDPAEAMGRLTIEGETVRWSVAGRDPLELGWRFRPPGRRLPCLAPFAAPAHGQSAG